MLCQFLLYHRVNHLYAYIYRHIPSLPPSLSHPSRWSQSTELISLCYAAASHQLSVHIFDDFSSRQSFALSPMSGHLSHLQDPRISYIGSFIALTTLFHGCQLIGLFPSVNHGLLKGRNIFILESPIVNTQPYFYIYIGSPHFTIPPNYRHLINNLLPECMSILKILSILASHLSSEIFPFSLFIIILFKYNLYATVKITLFWYAIL